VFGRRSAAEWSRHLSHNGSGREARNFRALGTSSPEQWPATARDVVAVTDASRDVTSRSRRARTSASACRPVSAQTATMGIKGLTALISEHAPKAISVIRTTRTPARRRPLLTPTPPAQEHDIKTLFGRKVAIDASMSIYQFLIAVRGKDGEVLQNEQGETTRYKSCPKPVA
jgi:hypothetical protein